MTRLIEILISIAIVFALFVIVGIFLPSSRHLSESVQTNRRVAIAFDMLNSVRRFTATSFPRPQSRFQSGKPAHLRRACPTGSTCAGIRLTTRWAITVSTLPVCRTKHTRRTRP